jgi:tetratricopeptide (TPR) repeat protein
LRWSGRFFSVDFSTRGKWGGVALCWAGAVVVVNRGSANVSAVHHSTGAHAERRLPRHQLQKGGIELKWIALIASLSLTGCVSTLNEKNAHNYANAAVAAQDAGDWDSARRNWAKAASNAQLAGMSEKQLAIAYYEYGRASGATCFFEESEKYLRQSLAFDQENDGPIHMALLELARLKLAQGKYEEANAFFEELIPIYGRQKAAENDPAGVSLVYNEFANSLVKVGRFVEAAKYEERSKALKEASAGRKSPSEVTPYGQHCSQSYQVK